MVQNIENNINMQTICNNMCENIVNQFILIFQELNNPNHQLRNILSEKEIEKTMVEIKFYLLIFSLIRIFIVWSNDKNKIYEVRDVIYKYGMDIDYNQFNLFNRNEYNSINEEVNFKNFFSNISHKVFFCLKNCDFEQLSILFDSCERHLLSNDDISEKIYLRQNREFANIFNNLRVFFNEYNQFLYKKDFNDENVEIIRKNKDKLW